MGAFLGSLSTLSAPALGSQAIAEALRRSGVSPEMVDEVLMGCVLTGGIGQAPARQAALGAGLPNSVPCTTVNKVCGSGMKTVMMAAQAIRSGDADIVAAGGMESMSKAPYALDRARSGYRMGNGTIVDLMVTDGLWDPYNDCHMGNCGDATAAKLGITREQLDEFAANSVEKALAAQKSGRFSKEIISIEIPGRGGSVTVIDDDEQPGRANPSKLSGLRPAFAKDGVTTAGNASSINDGAAALIVASGSAVKKHGLRPIARFVASAQHAQEPQWFTTAPAFAVEKLFKKTGLSAADVDVFEVNEAFAVVAMAAAKEIGLDPAKLNPNGGAVALGHPIGMTGTRLILTAAYELKEKGLTRAVCTPCIGGGEATAVMIERVQLA